MKQPSRTQAVYFIGDIQYTRTPPASRTDTYSADVLAKIRWVSEQVGRADRAVLVGDIFHRKGRTTHGEVLDLLHASLDFTKPLLAIPGNHDMVGSNVEEARRSGPFGVLTSAGSHILDLTGDAFVALASVGAAIIGAPYTDHWCDSVAYLRSQHSDVSVEALLVAIHTDTEGEERKVLRSLREAFPKVGVIRVFNGHLHDKRSTHTRDSDSFHYVGALTRVSANEASLRPVIARCSLVDGAVVSLLDVPVRPSSEVFEMKGEDDSPTSTLEEFAVALREFRTESIDDSFALKRLARTLRVKRTVWLKAKSYLDATR